MCGMDGYNTIIIFHSQFCGGVLDHEQNGRHFADAVFKYVFSKENSCIMLTSSNGNIFRVTDPLWRESIDHRWIPLTEACDG